MKHLYLSHPKEGHTLSKIRMFLQEKKSLHLLSMITLSPRADMLLTGPGVILGSFVRLVQAGFVTAGQQENKYSF